MWADPENTGEKGCGAAEEHSDSYTAEHAEITTDDTGILSAFT